jgi:hypothetical protein
VKVITEDRVVLIEDVHHQGVTLNWLLLLLLLPPLLLLLWMLLLLLNTRQPSVCRRVVQCGCRRSCMRGAAVQAADVCAAPAAAAGAAPGTVKVCVFYLQEAQANLVRDQHSHAAEQEDGQRCAEPPARGHAAGAWRAR